MSRYISNSRDTAQSKRSTHKNSTKPSKKEYEETYFGDEGYHQNGHKGRGRESNSSNIRDPQHSFSNSHNGHKETRETDTIRTKRNSNEVPSKNLKHDKYDSSDKDRDRGAEKRAETAPQKKDRRGGNGNGNNNDHNNSNGSGRHANERRDTYAPLPSYSQHARKDALNNNKLNKKELLKKEDRDSNSSGSKTSPSSSMASPQSQHKDCSYGGSEDDKEIYDENKNVRVNLRSQGQPRDVANLDYYRLQGAFVVNLRQPGSEGITERIPITAVPSGDRKPAKPLHLARHVHAPLPFDANSGSLAQPRSRQIGGRACRSYQGTGKSQFSLGDVTQVVAEIHPAAKTMSLSAQKKFGDAITPVGSPYVAAQTNLQNPLSITAPAFPVPLVKDPVPTRTLPLALQRQQEAWEREQELKKAKQPVVSVAMPPDSSVLTAVPKTETAQATLAPSEPMSPKKNPSEMEHHSAQAVDKALAALRARAAERDCGYTVNIGKINSPAASVSPTAPLSPTIAAQSVEKSIATLGWDSQDWGSLLKNNNSEARSQQNTILAGNTADAGMKSTSPEAYEKDADEPAFSFNFFEASKNEEKESSVDCLVERLLDDDDEPPMVHPTKNKSSEGTGNATATDVMNLIGSLAATQQKQPSLLSPRATLTVATGSTGSSLHTSYSKHGPITVPGTPMAPPDNAAKKTSSPIPSNHLNETQQSRVPPMVTSIPGLGNAPVPEEHSVKEKVPLSQMKYGKTSDGRVIVLPPTQPTSQLPSTAYPQTHHHHQHHYHYHHHPQPYYPPPTAYHPHTLHHQYPAYPHPGYPSPQPGYTAHYPRY